MLQNIFLIAGLFILLGGLVSWYNTRNFLSKCVKTKAVIISHNYQTSSDEDQITTTTFPIFRFKDLMNETEYTVQSRVSGYIQEGKEVEILYDPENPKNAKMNKLSNTWMIPIIVNFLGIFFSFIGVLVRNSVIGTITFIDQIIIFLLVIVLVFSLVKYIKIRKIEKS